MDVECTSTIDLDNFESKYRVFFECALDIVFLVDINGNFLDANHAAVREYGYTHDELLRMNARDLRVPRERGSAEEQFRVAFDKGAVYETVHMRRDGSELPVEISSRGLILNKRKVLLTVVRDISKRKEAEKSLARLASILESSDDAIVGMTLTGIITDWNRGAEKLYGYSAGEVVGKSVSILIPQNHKKELQKIIDTIKQNGSSERYETERIRKNGSTIIVSLTASPIKGPHGGILGISWTARDITERKRIEADLKRRAILIDLSPDAYMVRLPDGLITYWSKGAESLYGWTKEEVVGKKTDSLLRTRYPQPLEQIMRQLEDTGYWSGELTHITKDNRQIIVQSRWQARFYSNHSMREIMESNVDITERKKAEEDLEKARAHAEVYLDLMGHDINNMNQVALGYLEVALESLHLTEEERELLEKPLDALKNSSTLIDNVRKLQKLEEGGLKNRKIDLCVILDEVKKDYSHVPGRSVTINFKPLPHCYAIANELVKDVFANLVGNAIKHSDPGKPLTINLGLELVKEKGRDFYKVTVEDNGPGIPDDVKTRLFMRFQRGTTKVHGKGLGLYLVRTLVRDYGGRIWVEDRVKGDHSKGARFVVLLPAIE